MAIERYGGLELSIQRAFKRAPSPYVPAYTWFLEHEGFVGPRPWQKHAPDNIEIKLCAQSGIQKPSGFPLAVSVTSAGTDVYSRDAIHHFEDGTWLFEYCAHRLNSGEAHTIVEYNRSLRRCLVQGLPVGVFIKQRAGVYKCFGLAFVEQYDSASDTFLLHGPARIDGGDALSPISSEDRKLIEQDFNPDGRHYVFGPDEIAETILDALPSDEDERTRVLAKIVRRKRQAEFRQQLLQAYDGRCAISQFDIAPTLQAAHICSYLGPRSQMVTNGLLLRADLHILFDRMLISVDPGDMRIRISKQLENSCYAELERRPLVLPADRELRPSECRLSAHHDAFLRSEQGLEGALSR